MIISISGFRCYDSLRVYKIENGKITLIKGESGCGKSTIFNSIYWALYGDLRHVDNGSTHDCMVSLQLDGYTITRRRKPNLFQVCINETTYIDDIGQDIINQKFGSSDFWRTCCYIKQGDRCELCTGTNAQKLEILNNLTFNNDNPDEHIKKIDSEINTLDQQLTQVSNQITIERNLLECDLKNEPIDLNNLLTLPQLHDKEQQLVELREKLGNLEKRRIQQHKLSGMYQSYTETLNQLQNKLNKIPFVDPDELQRTNNQIEQLDKDSKLIQQYNKLNDILINNQHRLHDIQKKCPEITSITQSITEQDLWEQRKLEQEYNDNYNRCNQLHIEYDPKVIKKEEETLKEHIDSLICMDGKMSQLRNYQHIESSLQNELSIQESIESNIEALQKLKLQKETLLDSISEVLLEPYIKEEEEYLTKLNEMAKSFESIQCPLCQGYVKIYKNKLVPCNQVPVSQEHYNQVSIQYQQICTQHKEGRIQNDKRSKLMTSLNNVQSQIDKETNNLQHCCHKIEELRNTLNIMIDNLGGISQIEMLLNSNFDKNMLQKYRERLNKIKNIKYIQLPSCNSQTLQYYLDYNKVQSDIDNITSKIQMIKCPSNITLLQCNEQLMALKLKYNNDVKNYHTRNELEQEINSIKDKISKIHLEPNIDSEYNQVNSIVQQLTTSISKGKYTMKMVQRQEQINQQITKQAQLGKSITKLKQFRCIAVDTECQLLQNVVENINRIVDDILGVIFNEPIKVNLKLFKQLKKDNKIKQQVNFNICYRGLEYDNINELSGGEGDRISLALVIALNRISGCPFLLLDECMSSLDGNVREQCVTCIRQWLGDIKTVMCVLHETVEGYFDETINL